DVLGTAACNGLTAGDGVTTVPASSVNVSGAAGSAFATTPSAVLGPTGSCTSAGCVTISNYDLVAASTGSAFTVNFNVQDSYSPLTADGSGDLAPGAI